MLFGLSLFALCSGIMLAIEAMRRPIARAFSKDWQAP